MEDSSRTINPLFGLTTTAAGWLSIILSLVLLSIIIWKKQWLQDMSLARNKPISLSRVQLAWWTWIILSCILTYFIYYSTVPQLNTTVLALLGISTATTAVGRTIDTNDRQRFMTTRHQNNESSGFLIDILSDENGLSIHRFQSVVFNLIYGIMFLQPFIAFISSPLGGTELSFPNYEPQTWGLLGISSAAYAAVKMTENKDITPQG